MLTKYWVPCIHEYINNYSDKVKSKTGGVFTSEKLAVYRLIDLLIEDALVRDKWCSVSVDQECKIVGKWTVYPDKTGFLSDYRYEEKDKFCTNMRDHFQTYESLIMLKNTEIKIIGK